ncbi:MAG TPA: substrate-binding domain-containing protein [Spirochaetota bacterium]|nr:substrate-binding domain-containing protein [Spirochaetota bacterium]
MDDFLNTKQASELLKVNEKKLYVLAQQGKVPATMVTGKWLFPRKKLEEYIESRASENLITIKKVDYDKIILGSGSDDPTIELIESSFLSFDRDYNFFYSRIGSFNGLELLKNNCCDISFSHIYDYSSNKFNFTFLEKKFDINKIVVINLFHRNIGFVYKKDADIDNFSDIVKNRLNFINRQAGSGIRSYVDFLIKNENLKSEDIIGYSDEVKTHNEIGLKILFSNKDVGIATEHIAHLFNLNFKFLQNERFDLIISKDSFFEKKIQRLIDLIRLESFKNKVLGFKGYDIKETGKVIFDSKL